MLANPIRRILVPVDLEAAADTALERALAAPDGPDGTPAQIIALYVVEAPPVTAIARLARGPFDAEEVKGKAFAALREHLTQMKASRVDAMVTVGQPAEEISRVAAQEHIDLVVIPSHRRGGLDRLLLGSVSERVVRLCPCPVLVLRDRPSERNPS